MPFENTPRSILRSFPGFRTPRHCRWPLLAICITCGFTTATASTTPPPLPQPEAKHTGWEFHLDNDRLSLTELDEGYTAGFGFARSGRQAKEALLSLHGPLAGLTRWLDRETDNAGTSRYRYHSVSYGMAAFTPGDIESEDPISDDRPYACLLYTASTQQTVVPAQEVARMNTLSVGLLGTNVCEEVQNLVHEFADGIESKGWRHQISEGGEPTALWRLSRIKLLHYGNGPVRHEVSWSSDAQLGWATDAGIGITWRWGRIRSPWWSFTPQQTEYAPIAAIPVSHYRTRSPDSEASELYVWAGAMVRYRLYNSLLQGQFRESTVEVGNDRINPLLAEVWVGFTQSIDDRWGISLSLHARSREFDAPDSRSVLWGNLALRRTY